MTRAALVRSPWRFGVMAILASALAAGCTVGPDYRRPAVVLAGRL